MPSISAGKRIVSTAQLGDNVVEQADLADNAVGDAEIAAHTTTKITVPTTQLSGTVATAQIADNAVTLDKIADGTQGGVPYYGASGAPAELPAGTSGYFLKSQGAGANPIWDAAGGSLYSASDTQVFAADSVNTGTDTSFVTSKAIQVYLPGSVRVKWSHANNGTGDADAYIAINGVDQEAGAVHRVSSSTYSAFSLDVYVCSGDVVQLKIKSSTNYKCKEFRICGTKAAMSADGSVITD